MCDDNMRKGDIAFDNLIKVILVLVVIAILIGFFTDYLDDMFKWACRFASDKIRKIPGLEDFENIC